MDEAPRNLSNIILFSRWIGSFISLQSCQYKPEAPFGAHSLCGYFRCVPALILSRLKSSDDKVMALALEYL